MAPDETAHETDKLDSRQNDYHRDRSTVADLVEKNAVDLR